MKTNGAPKKLYLLPNGLISYCRNTDEDVEYTRTDAFIEKACDAYCAVCDTKECQGCAECSWVIKFRKQIMKIL